MLTSSKTGHQTNFFGTDLLLQLDSSDPLIQLSLAIPWADFEQVFNQYYTKATGRPSKPIRLMVGLLLLKQLENLSDEKVVLQFKRNPYYQVFCGLTEFSNKLPCDSTELVKFRNRIGKDGFETIFQMSVQLHGKAAQEDTVNIDTTVQEKNITYPTDAKLAIKIINRLNKLATSYDIQQRRTYKKEIKNLRLSIRHFRHPRRRKSAKKALKRLRTIAGILIGIATDGGGICFLLDFRIKGEPRLSSIGLGDLDIDEIIVLSNSFTEALQLMIEKKITLESIL